ncbi:MAG: phosphate ABC transporter permease subunit PstC, partial [Campylobacterota bacterium]|nr:phosphate ABC transporter permease subunit PstC [Campylobacterota bacterium]
MEKIFQKLALSSASLVFIILVGIFITLFSSSKLAIDEFGFDFITNPDWNKEVVIDSPVLESSLVSDVESDEIIDEDDEMIEDEDDMMLFDEESATKTIYGGLVPIVGTLLTTLIALVFALPIAMGIAVFLA